MAAAGRRRRQGSGSGRFVCSGQAASWAPRGRTTSGCAARRNSHSIPARGLLGCATVSTAQGEGARACLRQGRRRVARAVKDSKTPWVAGARCATTRQAARSSPRFDRSRRTRHGWASHFRNQTRGDFAGESVSFVVICTSARSALRACPRRSCFCVLASKASSGHAPSAPWYHTAS